MCQRQAIPGDGRRPDAYFAKLKERTNAEEKAGRKVIRSAGELRTLAAEQERQRASPLAMVLNDQPQGS